MITGYNTDVDFQGVTYHVQTEDKGLNSPMIMSLVYNGGTILLSKREPYDDLIKSGFSEKLLVERLRKQHKTLCAAVKKGRIDELRGLGKKSAAKQSQSEAEPVKPVKTPTKSQSKNSKASVKNVIDTETISNFRADAFSELVTPIPMPNAAFTARIEKPMVEPVIDGVAVIDVAEVVPVEAVHVVSDLAGTERPETSKLSLEFVGGDTFRGGTICNVVIMVCRGSRRRVVEGAEVMVKVLGSSFRPLIFHSMTDRNGISNVAVQLPNFTTGRASILVRALSQSEEVEVRRVIAHG